MKTNANINSLRKNLLDAPPASQMPAEQFQLSQILNNSEEFLLIINDNYEILTCNQYVQKTVKQHLNIDLNPGDDFFCMVAPGEKERVKGFCDRAFKGEKIEFEYKVSLDQINTLYFQCIIKPAINNKGEIPALVIIFKETTGKKKDYEAIMQSEQRWRFALEGSNQGVWDWKLDTNDVYFSSSWRKMLGYDQSALINNMSEWEDLIHPDDKNRMAAHIEKHLNSGNPYYESELRLKAFDGSYKWILARGMIFNRSGDGKPSRMIGTHTDISERKKTEENYKLLFYNNPIPMWTYDRKTLQFLDVNYAAVNHYGYSREEFLQMTILDIRPEEDIEKVKQSIKQNIRTSNQTIWRHKKKNGEIIKVNLSLQVFEGDVDEHCLAIAEDITEKLRIESNLKASEKQYRTLFKTNPLPSFIYDRDTLRFLEVNDAAVKFYGYSFQEFSQITLFDLQLPQNREALKKSIAEKRYYKTALIPNWSLVNKAGEELVADISTSSIFYNGLEARLVVVNDITEKVKAEKEIKEINRRFEFVSKATSDIIWDWDIKNDRVFLSENFYKILGWKLPPDNIVNIDFLFSKGHPEDMDRLIPKLTQMVNDPNVFHWDDEFRYQKSDGSYIYLSDRAYISRNEKGEAIRMTGAVENISARKYQEELQLMELRVFEVSAIPDIHFHTVLKTLINGYENLHRGTHGTVCVLGLANDMEILAPGFDKAYSRQLQYFIEKQKSKLSVQQEVENTIVISPVDSEDWKTGIDTAPLYDWKTSWSIPVNHHRGDLLGFITVFSNQSREPSHVEKNTLLRMRNLLRILMVNHLSLEQIRVSNERYDNVLKATHDLVWDWNLETGNFYRNKDALRKVYGIDNEESIQNVYTWMERIHPADHIKVQRVINNILHSTDEDAFDVEYRFKGDDGVYAFIYDRGIIVRNKEGKPLRMIGAAQNITDRKKLEHELLQQELDKQKFISQATIDTQEEERREIGKELHDNVNQVLTTTKLYLDLSQSSPDLKDELIQKSSKNIIYVINEIRQLSRSLMDPSIGDLGLVDSINDLIENINITRKLHVSLSATPDLEQYLDESQKLMIFRVIQEAMNNTIKYAHATSVQLSIKKIGKHLELVIADDGQGFNIKTVKKGAGLKNIQNRVYLTGGKLEIESGKEKGCRIIINFPINNNGKI